MKLKKVLILGSNGMLGRKLFEQFEESFWTLGIDKESDNSKNKNLINIDILNLIEIKKILKTYKFDIIINAIAIVDLKKCELEKELANNLHINVHKIFVDYCNNNNTKYIYISTDSVFDGVSGNYLENSSPRPLNYYALTKFLGEEEVKKIQNHIIVRTNIIGYSKKQNSLLKWAYWNLKTNTNIEGYENVIFNPISVKKLSYVIMKLIENDYKGIINVASNLKLSKYEFLNILKQMLNSKSNIRKISMENKDIIRPLNTTLDNNLLFKVLPSLKLDFFEELNEVLIECERNFEDESYDSIHNY